ncbi:hypothetical protein OFN19_18280, partial [Acinetobacter baumannii]|nr:hypothetical protein [Acinetobacter baumannii]
ARDAMDVISLNFYEMMRHDNKKFLNLDHEDMLKSFHQISYNLGYQSVSILLGYFQIYTSLCQLITNSDISENDKEFYKNVLSNTMSQGEQILLFWLLPMFKTIDISESEIFSMFGYTERFEQYALKFHKKSHFKYDEWKRIYSKENPA